jgi:hypothetical protein
MSAGGGRFTRGSGNGGGSETSGDRDGDEEESSSNDPRAPPDRMRGRVGPNTGLDRGDGGAPDPSDDGDGGGDDVAPSEMDKPRGRVGRDTGLDRGDGGGPDPPDRTPSGDADAGGGARTRPRAGPDRGDGGAPDVTRSADAPPIRQTGSDGVPRGAVPPGQASGRDAGLRRGPSQDTERLGDSFISVGDGRDVEGELEDAAGAVDRTARVAAERQVDRAVRGGGSRDPVTRTAGTAVAAERAAVDAADRVGLDASAYRGVTPDASEGPVETTAESFFTGANNVVNAPDAALSAIEAGEAAGFARDEALTSRGRAAVDAGVGAVSNRGSTVGAGLTAGEAAAAAAGDGPLVDREGAETVGASSARAVAARAEAAASAPLQTGGRFAGGAAAGAGAGLVAGAGASSALRAAGLPDVPGEAARVSRRATSDAAARVTGGRVGRRSASVERSRAGVDDSFARVRGEGSDDGGGALENVRRFASDERGQLSAGTARSRGDSGETSGSGSEFEGVTGEDPTSTFGTRGRATGLTRGDDTPSVGPRRPRSASNAEEFAAAARLSSRTPGDDLRSVADVERRLRSSALDDQGPEDLTRRRTPSGDEDDTSLARGVESDSALFQRSRAAGSAAGGAGAGGFPRSAEAGAEPRSPTLPRGEDVASTITGTAPDSRTSPVSDAGPRVDSFTDTGITPLSGTTPGARTTGSTTTSTTTTTGTDTDSSTTTDLDPFFRSRPDGDDDGPLRRPRSRSNDPGGSGGQSSFNFGFASEATFDTGFADAEDVFDGVFE